MLRVALTFDVEHPDRPTRERTTEAILAALAAADVRATMFLQGRWVRAYPALARAVAAGGHLVGNHSHFHARMTMLTGNALASDVRTATSTIRDVVGVDPRPWFRSPFGALDRGTRVLEALARLGYRNIGWHVDSRDWASRGARTVASRVVDGVRAHGNGAIVLSHGWPWPTGEALPEIIERLRDEGADFVTVNQLARVPMRAGWDTGPELSDAPALPPPS
jgi:peptidoglycan/xylan/chitin deacetylase (PgdA/CDA1 family)